MHAGTVIVLVVLVAATAAAPVSMAIVAQRRGPAVAWLRRHVRGIYVGIALLWLASLLLRPGDESRHAQIHLVTSTLGFLCAVGLALFNRPDEAPPSRHARVSGGR